MTEWDGQMSKPEVAAAINLRVRMPKAAEVIAAQIRGQIVRRELVPGMTLPPENILLDQFGVSRPTLRQAFRILETEGLIRVGRGFGGGAHVLMPDAAVAARNLGLILQLEGTTIDDVYRARTVLESVCARLMAGVKDADSIAGLYDCIDRVSGLIVAASDGIPDPHAWTRTTFEFHEKILHGSGNKTLALQGELLQNIVALHYAVTERSRFQDHSRPGRFRLVRASFTKLADLVAAGDTAGAYNHWLSHMNTAAKTLLGDDLADKPLVDLFADETYVGRR